MDIRKIISEEIGRVFKENYPTGAAIDPSAPWNQSDNTRSGEKASKIKYNVIWTDGNEFAFLKDAAGNKYVMNIYSINKNDLEPYADREEKFIGKDEDGMLDVEYGDWNITEDVIENYVNNNLDSIKVGKGVSSYEDGDYDIVILDDDLRKNLLSIVPFMKDENKKKTFMRILSGDVNEGGVTDKIVNKKTMDTPTGTLFIMDFGTSGE